MDGWMESFLVYKMLLPIHSLWHSLLSGGYWLATNEKHFWDCLGLFRVYLESGHKTRETKT